MAKEPKALMFAWTITLASETTEFCTPEGMPRVTTWRSMGPSKRILRQFTR